MAQKDPFVLMGDELRSLFKELKAFQPSRREIIRLKMEKILQMAKEAEGTILDEAKQLHLDVEAFLKNPENPELSQIVRKLAMRLEQETREL